MATLEKKHPCQAIRVVHRLGVVPKGRERDLCGNSVAPPAGGIPMLQEFMDELKKDVPIWKTSLTMIHHDFSLLEAQELIDRKVGALD